MAEQSLSGCKDRQAIGKRGQAIGKQSIKIL
jgi:hypothetical protein